MLPKTKETWEKWIESLKCETTDLDQSKYIQELANLLEKTILKEAKEKIGVLFSGGVDSTLICHILKKNNISFKAISVGFYDENKKFPEDLENSRKIAKELQLDYYEIILNTEEIEILFKETTKILGKGYSDVVNVGVGSVEVAGIKKLKELGCESIFSGLGSEEIFAGYDRHDKSEDPHNECWIGLKSMFERDLIREFKIANYFNIKTLVPFLDEDLIKYAMKIPVKYKISKTKKKIILRKAAKKLGLQDDFSQRPKRAAQYGSRTDKAIANLAKKHKFKYKKDYILSLLN